MSWRPKDWDKIKKGNYYVEIDEEVYEAGADAMLEALKKEGFELPLGAIYLTNGERRWKLHKPEGCIGGVVVIIPDEEDNGKS